MDYVSKKDLFGGFNLNSNRIENIHKYALNMFIRELNINGMLMVDLTENFYKDYDIDCVSRKGLNDDEYLEKLKNYITDLVNDTYDDLLCSSSSSSDDDCY